MENGNLSLSKAGEKMDEKEVNNLIEWAKEVEKKCAYSAAYILAAHGRANNKLHDSEAAKVKVANELINGK